MCAEIPQKVAAQKGAFKLSNKLFFHTLRKYRKTFAAAKVQQKDEMCKEKAQKNHRCGVVFVAGPRIELGTS